MALLLPLVIIFTITSLIYFIQYRLSRRRLYELCKFLPGDDGLPILGHGLEYFGKDITTPFLKFGQHILNHNGVCKQWFGNVLMIRLTNADDVELVLNNALEKGENYRYFESWLGNSLLHAKVPFWRRHRKVLNQIFNQKILESYIDTFNKDATKFVEVIDKEAGKASFDVFEYVLKYSADTICKTSLGVELNSQIQNSAYVEAAHKQSYFMFDRMVKAWLQIDWIYKLTSRYREEMANVKLLHDYTSNIVRRKLREFEKNGHFGEASSLLEYLIKLTQKNDDKWSVEELQGEADMVVAAGNDTTGVSIGYLLMMLGHYPEIQKRVYEEQLEIFGNSGRDVQKEDLPRMQYLDLVIKETLRLLSPAANLIRKLDTDLKITNYTLPAQANCFIHIWGMHRDPKIWGDDALEFNPDRFLPERSAHIKPFNYLPFSRGPRNCIGFKFAEMSIKTFTSVVIRKYKIHSDYDHKNIKTSIAVTVKPTKGILISLEKRNEK